MKVSASSLRKEIRSIWPGVQFIWMPDKFYIKPKIEEIKELLSLSEVAKMRFDGELVDCDDYSLLLNAFMKKYRIDHSEKLTGFNSFHWSFGEAFGTKVNRVETHHTLNLCIAVEGMFLVEPQTYEVREASNNNDSILIVKM